jgi:ABC-type branched-subunit amino acid transport system ATPase component
MLTCSGVGKSFDANAALTDIDLSIAAGEIVSVIGPNGSGKSTLINVISGLYTADTGTVSLEGEDITRSSPQDVRRLGVARTFQNLRLFDELSLLDNMLLGLHLEIASGRGMVRSFFASQARLPRLRRSETSARLRAREALASVGLSSRADERVSSMSYGDRKRAELAQSLLSRPKLLLLDEPTAGLSPEEAAAMQEIFAAPAREHGMAVLLVEHRLEWVLKVSDRVVAMDAGRKIADGEPDVVASDPTVRRVYIGA